MHNSTDGHVPELDGLRAVAISLVMLQHFTFPLTPYAPFARALWRVASSGWIGVDLFFVLSGFLITGICLDHAHRPGFLRAFYARRALRILPAYALLLGILCVIGIAESGRVPDGLLWSVAFATNMQAAFAGPLAVPLNARHLWSIAIEEQFYLAWPLVVALCSRLTLSRALLAALPVALLVRFALQLGGAPLGAPRVLMPARMDTLAVGALIALAWRDAAQWGRPSVRWIGRLARVPAWGWLLGVLGLCAAVRGLSDNGGDSNTLLLNTLGLSVIAVLMGLVLVATLAGHPDAPLRVTLRHRALRAVGRHSYAIYLLHWPLNTIVSSAFHPTSAQGAAAYILGLAGLVYVCAGLTWRTVEAPALAMKRYFAYARPLLAGAAVARVA